MKDNRWLEIDGDLLEEAINSPKKRTVRFRRLLIASLAAVLSVSVLFIGLIPYLAQTGSESQTDHTSEEGKMPIDIYEIIGNYNGKTNAWDGGTDLKLVTLSGEKNYSTSGSKSNGSDDSDINKSLDVTLSEMPNVKLDRFTSGRFIDMTGKGQGRYDWDQESTGIYRDIITGEFFSLQDEIRFALMGEELGLLEDEFLLLTACSMGVFKFSDDVYEHERLYFGIVEGEISYSEAIQTLDEEPDGFGFTSVQEEALRRYFKGEEFNVGELFYKDSSEQHQFNFRLVIQYHSLLKRRCGDVNIHEFGMNESKCFFTREHWIKGGSGVFVCDLGIYDRETKEITLVTGDIDSSILFSLTLFGSEFRVNEDYNMLAYIDTSDGRLCLIDAVNGKYYTGSYSPINVENDSSEGEDEAEEISCDHKVSCDCLADVAPEEYVPPVKLQGVGVVGRINFSPNDKYIYCKLNTENEAWLFLDSRGEFANEIYGRFVKFVAGGNAVIMQTESGFRIYDVATKTDITDHCGDLFMLEEHETHAFFEADGKIVWKNLINDEEKVVAEIYDAFLTDKNSGCVYVFTLSDRTVRGYSATDGECKYEARVGESFAENAPSNAIFNLLLDGSENLLLVSYYTPLSLEFDESKFLELKGEYWDIGGDVSSIPDFGYIYLRSVKYNGNYLDCYDSDDVNGEVDNIGQIGRYLLFEEILDFASDDMIVDLDELVELGHLFAERIEPYIVIDSMNRVKVIPEGLTEIFGYELNTGEHFFWNVYLPATRPYSTESGKEYIANMVSVNIDRLSNGKESEEIKAFKKQLTQTLVGAYKSYLTDGYYRMKYEIKLQIRDRIESEYQKSFG